MVVLCFTLEDAALYKKTADGHFDVPDEFKVKSSNGHVQGA